MSNIWCVQSVTDPIDAIKKALTSYIPVSANNSNPLNHTPYYDFDNSGRRQMTYLPWQTQHQVAHHIGEMIRTVLGLLL